MNFEVPSNFDKPWNLSDVVLHTNDSNGKVIYAYKGALATFSPYFNVLFFGGFKENGAASLNVDCDYDVMLEILRNIHQIGFNYIDGKQPTRYSAYMLYKLYKAADLFDFAFIRKLCVQQMEGFANVQMAMAAGLLGLYEIRINILKKLTKQQLREFLKERTITTQSYLTKEEFLFLFEGIVGKPLPKPTEPSEEKPKDCLHLNAITDDLENPEVDFTKQWLSDTVFITNNARGRVLYANKATIDAEAPNFNKYIKNIDSLIPESSIKFTARLNAEYTTIKEILSIIHGCNTDVDKPDRILHPALLHSMYCVADENSLDIPMIRDFCVDKLIKHQSVDAVDVLWRLALNRPVIQAIKKLSVPQRRDWVYRQEGHFSYKYGDKIIAITPSPKKPTFSNVFASTTIDEFKSCFFKD